MIRQFFIFIYKITGWSISGNLPALKKYLIIVAPHTSYWDFPVGIAARSILRLKSGFLAKGELFKNPIVGGVLKAMGGIPVNRSANTNLVDAVVKLYNESEEMVVTITPEGTRAYVPKWKTGFYYIAKNAEIPIVMIGFDFARKLVDVREPFYATGKLEEDMEVILDYFRGFTAKHPENGVR